MSGCSSIIPLRKRIDTAIVRFPQTRREAPIATIDPVPADASLEIFDPEVLQEAVARSRLTHILLDRGPFRGRLASRLLDDLRLDAGCYNRRLIARGEFAEDRLVIGCILDAREAGCINGFRLGRGDLVLFPEGSEMDYLLPAFTDWTALQVPRSYLTRAGIDGRLLGQMRVLPRSTSRHGRLAGLIAGLTRSVTTPRSGMGVTATRVRDELIDALCGTLGALSEDRIRCAQPSFRERTRLLRRFEEAVEALGADAVRIPALSARLGIPQRTLEHFFKEHVGVPPRRYAALLRLNAVHRELLAACPDSAQVSGVAAAHGIGHLGRFAGDYRALFGEMPSRTLARRC